MKLTLEQSEKLLSDGYDEFCDFISMDDDAASVLAAYVGTLSFPDLLKISESQAQLLSKHEGGLSFTGLKELSVQVAIHLAASRDDLCLDGSGVSELNDDVVQALAEHNHGSLELGLTHLTDIAAQHLAPHKSGLVLPALVKLSDTAADLIARHRGPLRVNESLLSDNCDLHQRLVRHPSIWASPLTLSKKELAEAVERENAEAVVELADGFSEFFHDHGEYYGDLAQDLLEMFRKAPWKPICMANGVDIDQEYADRFYYFVGTKAQVLARISAVE